MKLTILIVLMLAIVGCTTAPPPNTVATKKNPISPIITTPEVNVDDFRAGMTDGATLSTVVAGQALCDVLKAKPSSCQEMQVKMATLASMEISKLTDNEVKELAKKDSSYRASLKTGAVAFSLSVGKVLCATVNISGAECTELQVAMTQPVHEFIDSLPDEKLKELKEKTKTSSNSNDLAI